MPFWDTQAVLGTASKHDVNVNVSDVIVSVRVIYTYLQSTNQTGLYVGEGFYCHCHSLETRGVYEVLDICTYNVEATQHVWSNMKVTS